MERELASLDLASCVDAARHGDEAAWNAIVADFTPLIVGIARSHRLSDSDALDVAQHVWLKLVEHLDSIRNVKSLPGWISVTTRNACFATKRRGQRVALVDKLPEVRTTGTDVSDHLTSAVDIAAVRNAFRHLGAACRELLSLCAMDPPMSYGQISGALDMPIGSIGPSRARCLAHLRRKLSDER